MWHLFLSANIETQPTPDCTDDVSCTPDVAPGGLSRYKHACGEAQCPGKTPNLLVDIDDLGCTLGKTCHCWHKSDRHKSPLETRREGLVRAICAERPAVPHRFLSLPTEAVALTGDPSTRRLALPPPS